MFNEESEVWRVVEIDGEKWPYEISNKGRIKSLERLVNCKGNSKRLVKEKILNTSRDSHGYKFVGLGNNGKHKTCWIHILVCTVFHGPRPKDKEVRHWPDRTKTNNYASNLSWATHQDNEDDKIIHNTRPRGKNHRLAKLTDKDIPVIRKHIKDGLTHADIAKKFGVTKGAIGHIRHNRAWTHVPLVAIVE